MQEVGERCPVEEARIGVRRRWKDTITDHALGRNSSLAGCWTEDCLICCEVMGTGEGNGKSTYCGARFETGMW